ncbi:hypothetical protein ST47_g1919 [Ascochyta rabiei]|uniref:Uncharacterized protein n=1 Tax=Didymella rabiei TaxID=5454 RepID=A0A163KG31_DIDRA|nr:hypothetical protein ST47_g1919 [Ascochyta rabiei]
MRKVRCVQRRESSTETRNNERTVGMANTALDLRSSFQTGQPRQEGAASVEKKRDQHCDCPARRQRGAGSPRSDLAAWCEGHPNALLWAGQEKRRGALESRRPPPANPAALQAPAVSRPSLDGAGTQRDRNRSSLHPADPDRTQLNPDGTTPARKAEQHRRPALNYEARTVARAIRPGNASWT